jgi:hypothetical protein
MVYKNRANIHPGPKEEPLASRSVESGETDAEEEWTRRCVMVDERQELMLI